MGDLPALSSALSGSRLKRVLLECVSLGLFAGGSAGGGGVVPPTGRSISSGVGLSLARDFIPCTLRGHCVGGAGAAVPAGLPRTVELDVRAIRKSLKCFEDYRQSEFAWESMLMGSSSCEGDGGQTALMFWRKKQV